MTKGSRKSSKMRTRMQKPKRTMKMKRKRVVKKNTRRRRGGNSDWVANINKALREEMSKGNISFSCFQCLLMNNVVGKMVEEKAAKWGNLTVSEWTTRVLHDNTVCTNCIV